MHCWPLNNEVTIVDRHSEAVGHDTTAEGFAHVGVSEPSSLGPIFYVVEQPAPQVDEVLCSVDFIEVHTLAIVNYPVPSVPDVFEVG